MLALPFLKDVLLPLGIVGFVAFGGLVMVGASNAVNLTDGLDGLAIGPVIMASAVFGLITYVVGNTILTNYLYLHHVPRSGELAVLLAALIGAGLGFLWFNAPPAMVFMGDTGSLAIGGALGAVAVVTKHEIVLAIVGGLFVLETVSVIVQVLSYKWTGAPRLPHGAAASSFRAEGVGRAHHRLPLLDHRRHPGDGRPRHAEAEVSG